MDDECPFIGNVLKRTTIVQPRVRDTHTRTIKKKILHESTQLYSPLTQIVLLLNNFLVTKKMSERHATHSITCE